MRRVGLYLGISGVVCCWVSTLAQQPSSLAAAPQPSGVIRFHTVSIMDDPRHIGGEAYRVLAPVDWRVEGSIMWKNNGKESAAPWVKLIGPAKQEIGVLPPIAFIWSPQMSGTRYRPGTFYQGMEVQPLLDPVQCIKTVIISHYLRNLGSADVIKQEALPEVAEAGRQKYARPEYKNAAFQAGKMRFEFMENGAAMEADVYVLTVAIQVGAGQSASTLWAADEIRYSKAPKGTLDAQAPLFQTALFSLRPNLQWWANMQRVSQELGRLQMQTSDAGVSQAIQQQMAAADRRITLSRPPAKEADLINDSVIQGYRNYQAIIDRINSRWDRNIRGVEVYRNPATGEKVELPSGYTSAWVNKGGDYLVTGSLSFDPNSPSDGSWMKLEKSDTQ